jgi:hypothetical protein
LAGSHENVTGVIGFAQWGNWRAWATVLVVWVALVAVAFVLDDSGAAGGAVIGGGAAVLAAPFIVRDRRRRYAEHDRLECGLRVIEGQQSGLRPRWRHGVGTIAPGSLVFRSTVGGLRPLRRRPIALEVRQIDPSTVRATGAREAWSMWPGTEVVEVVTPSARLEWGVPASQMQCAMDRLHPWPADNDAH